MNVYFACSITGGRKDEGVYQAIVDALLATGHEVPTAILATPKAAVIETIVEPVEIYTRDVNWITACDTLVAEVSTPSHGVGYEICYALNRSKPVLCVYRKGVTVSKMILGNTDPNLRVRSYTSIPEAVRMVCEHLDVLNNGLRVE
jgi:hypothetical protein